ncbi:hypothetical protein HanPSC8_Chr01g0043491 [Helianthus annuus]|nr:hypothetical protein HanPSC8_Chr01g0043491 [Helianthus annuus]
MLVYIPPPFAYIIIIPFCFHSTRHPHTSPTRFVTIALTGILIIRLEVAGES